MLKPDYCFPLLLHRMRNFLLISSSKTELSKILKLLKVDRVCALTSQIFSAVKEWSFIASASALEFVTIIITLNTRKRQLGIELRPYAIEEQ